MPSNDLFKSIMRFLSKSYTDFSNSTKDIAVCNYLYICMYINIYIYIYISGIDLGGDPPKGGVTFSKSDTFSAPKAPKNFEK